MKKVVIVDDESSARFLIKEYLNNYPNLILVGEANNGVDAIQIINEFKPDIVFIDVKMPGLSGFDVLEHLEELPVIIFSTAYDKYAMLAFEAHATDYLLKPYTKQRFDLAISKINIEDSNKIASLADELIMSKDEYPERIILAKGNRYITIAVNEINSIEAYGDYSKIHTLSDTYLSVHGLGELYKKLNKKEFLRIHRSCIVYWPAVVEIDKLSKSYLLLLKNKTSVKVSRGYLEEIKKRIF
ncbi:MAG: response regulator transcription factor [Flavobacteriales bacterium]|nr:response regulator transcription factor [Flavobacteriales bacterium]